MMIICLHDIAATLFDSLIYFNLLPCYFFALLHGCCELASTFNVLTWRVMPDLQAVLWMRRTTFSMLRARRCPSQCPCGLEFVIVVLFRCCRYSAARVMLLVGVELRLA